MKSNWENNAIQFPRLISEIMATQEIDIEALCQSMDLTAAEVDQIFDRADTIWQKIKSPQSEFD